MLNALMQMAILILVLKKTNDAITVFPNPTEGILNISSTVNGVQLVSVTNMLGEIILSKEINLLTGASFTIDITGQPAGIYLFRLGSSVQRIVKR